MEAQSNQHASGISMVFYVGILVIGAIVNFFLNQRIASVLGAAGYGDFCVAVNLLWLLGVASVLGFDYLVSIEVPRIGSSLKRGVKFIVGLFNILIPIIIIVIICGVALLLLLLASKHVVALNLLKDIHPFAYFIWAIPLFGFYKYLISIIRVFGFYALSLVCDGVLLPFLIFTAFWLLLGSHVTTVRVILAPTIAALILLMILFIGILFYFKKRHLSVNKIYAHLSNRKEIVRTSVKFFVSTFLFNNVGSIVLLIIELVGQNEECVGYFAACLQCLMVTIFFVFSSLELVLIPHFSRLLHHNQHTKIQYLLTRAHMISAIFAFTICIFVYIFAPYLLSGFGREFTSFIPINMLRLSTLLIAPTFLVFYSNNIIAARARNATLAFVIAIVYCTAVVLVSIPLSYYFAGTGAVISLFGMLIIYYAFYVWLVYRKEHLRPF